MALVMAMAMGRGEAVGAINKGCRWAEMRDR
jgi:hypothetical protein